MITVIDSPCGAGKTYLMQHMMQNNPLQKYIYITPFLDECEMIRDTVPNTYMPSNRNNLGTKLNGVKLLLEHFDCNIASTHALFSRFNADLADIIQQNNYVLILDEVMNVVRELQKEDVNPADIPKLIESHCISIDDKTGKVNWIESPAYDGAFNKYASLFRDGDVFAIKNKQGKYTCYIWTFPIEIFKAFKDVYICTYMFDYQFQKFYYDLHDVKYIKKSIVNHELVDYTKQYIDCSKIHVYEGKSNYIGNNDDIEMYDIDKTKNTPFTVSWYKNRKPKTLTLVKNVMHNIQQNIFNCKSNDIIWTTYKAYKKQLSYKGYARSFIPCNSRSTNKYANRHYVMYMVDVRINPFISQFFSIHGVKLTKYDEDMYALSEMIQFICRSAVRKHEDIHVFIPSHRMRTILNKYISDGTPIVISKRGF